MLNQSLTSIATAFCLSAGSLFASAYLPFKNVIAQPSHFIICLESVAFVDRDGAKLELLTPIDIREIDLCKSKIYKMDNALSYASRANFEPVALRVQIKRNFGVTAETPFVDTDTVRLHTQAALPCINAVGIDNLSLASDSAAPATSQLCYLPRSNIIDLRINLYGVETPNSETLIYNIKLPSNLNNKLSLHIMTEGVEFGGQRGKTPYVVVPHLPQMKLIQE